MPRQSLERSVTAAVAILPKVEQPVLSGSEVSKIRDQFVARLVELGVPREGIGSGIVKKDGKLTIRINSDIIPEDIKTSCAIFEGVAIVFEGAIRDVVAFDYQAHVDELREELAKSGHNLEVSLGGRSGTERLVITIPGMSKKSQKLAEALRDKYPEFKGLPVLVSEMKRIS